MRSVCIAAYADVYMRELLWVRPTVTASVGLLRAYASTIAGVCGRLWALLWACVGAIGRVPVGAVVGVYGRV
jgi:hypothetical protein